MPSARRWRAGSSGIAEPGEPPRPNSRRVGALTPSPPEWRVRCKTGYPPRLLGRRARAPLEIRGQSAMPALVCGRQLGMLGRRRRGRPRCRWEGPWVRAAGIDWLPHGAPRRRGGLICGARPGAPLLFAPLSSGGCVTGGAFKCARASAIGSPQDHPPPSAVCPPSGARWGDHER